MVTQRKRFPKLLLLLPFLDAGNDVMNNLWRSAKVNGWIKECYLIKQVCFAATVSGTVHTAGAIDGKAAFAEAGVQAGGDLALSW